MSTPASSTPASSTPASSAPARTLFYTGIPVEEGASVEEVVCVEDVSLVYTGTLGVDDEVPV